MSFAFPRARRLTSKAAFDRVFQKPKKSASPWFLILYRANGLSYPRLGIALSKKQIKTAVLRNQTKRIIRESFRLHQSQLGAWDIVVLARISPAPQPAGAVLDKQQRQALDQQWLTLRLLAH